MHITGITKVIPVFIYTRLYQHGYTEPFANKQRHMIVKRRIFNSRYLE